MVKTKNILLKVDEKFFYKMKEHKLKSEIKTGYLMTWEDYIKLLFGLKK